MVADVTEKGFFNSISLIGVTIVLKPAKETEGLVIGRRSNDQYKTCLAITSIILISNHVPR